MRILHSLVLASAMTLPLAQLALADGTAATISVTGEGRVEVAPDMATISLGVTTTNPTAAEAMAANSAELAKVMANLKAAGIEDRDIQTAGLMLNPNWQYDSSGANPQILGYTAANTLSVRVRALDGLGGILDAAVKDGVNTLNGVTFGVAEPAPLLDEARKRAVDDAKHRATLLTTAAGSTLGRITSITEAGGVTEPGPMFRQMASDAASVPVAAGEIAIAVNVAITWEIAQ